jgi:hypothetical protein
MLEELDGTPLKRKFPGDQLKLYFARSRVELGWAEREEEFEDVEDEENVVVSS